MRDLSRYIGIPYEIGGRGPETVDCAGLVLKFYREEFGIELPPMLYDPEISREDMAALAESGIRSGEWIEIARPLPGDVLVFRMFGHPTHVGIYVGGDDFLHSVEGRDSCLERLSSWRSRLVGILRWHQRQ